MAPSNKQVLQGKDRQFIQLSIEQISVPRSTFNWIDNSNYFPMSIPAVKKDALSQLQLLQPILLVDTGKQINIESKKSKVPLYELVGGRRTLQLICEQMPPQTKIQATLLSKEYLDNKQSLEALDFLCSVLLHRPDEATKALLASALLDDTKFKKEASRFLNASNTKEIETLLGISHATLHRITNQPRQKLKKLLQPSPNTQTTLDFANFFDEI